MSKYRVVLLGFVIAYFLLFTLETKGDTEPETQNSILMVDSCVSNASFALTNPIGKFQDTVKVKFYFNSGGRKVDRIETQITWPASQLTYIGVDTLDYYSPWDSVNWYVEVYDETVDVTLRWIHPDTTFNNDSLFAIIFQVISSDSLITNQVRFAPGGCPDVFNEFWVYYDQSYWSIGPASGLAGDVNLDGRVNLGDLIYNVNYIFKGGPPPNLMRTGDVNADCKVNLGDVIYLVNYVFKGGTAPKPGCA